MARVRLLVRAHAAEGKGAALDARPLVERWRQMGEYDGARQRREAVAGARTRQPGGQVACESELLVLWDPQS